MTHETIATLVASPVVGAAAAKLWQWWTERDKATRESTAADRAAAVARDAAERVDLVAELKAARDAADRRADVAATGRAEVAQALAGAAHAQNDVAKELGDLAEAVTAGADRIVAKVDDLADTVDERLTRIETQLAALVGRTTGGGK